MNPPTAPVPGPSPKRGLGARCWRWLKRALFLAVGLVLLLAAFGFLFPKTTKRWATAGLEELLPRYLAWNAGTGRFTARLASLDEVKSPMLDGVLLATDVYLPGGTGPFPTIAIRTPYAKKDGRLIGDFFIEGQLRDFDLIQRTASPRVREQTKILIGPWNHAFFNGNQQRYGIRQGKLELVPFAFVRAAKDWFDYSLKGLANGWDRRAPVRVYVLGQNVWRDEQEWPPANAKPRAFYLHSGGKAQTLDGDGSLDSTATDTDFTAKLVDVFPDGQALIVCEGIVRARYRGGLDKPELLEPGRTYAFDIHVGNTAVQFQPGHRIRLEASSSNFPRYDPNPNTGQDIATERRPVSATQQVAHGPQFPSALLLPIVEE